MVKRKSVVSGSIAGAIVFFVLLPFDEILVSVLFAKFLLHFGWLESTIIGIIIGIVVFAIVEHFSD